MSMEGKFRLWVRLFIVLPFSLMLLFLDVRIFQLLQNRYYHSLSRRVEISTQALEEQLAVEVFRLRSFGIMPTVDSLLASNERLRRSMLSNRRNQIDSVRERWASLGREELVVREILDNSVGEMFHSICSVSPLVKTIFLTDSGGMVIAASEKPPLYSYQSELWWIRSHTRAPDVPVSDGLLDNGLLGLSLALRDSRRTNAVLGVIRIELDTQPLIRNFHNSLDTNRFPVVMSDTNITVVISSGGQHDKYLKVAEAVLLNASSPWFKKNGLRFLTRPLDAGIMWITPVYVAAFRPEGLVPFHQYGVVLILLIVSLLAVYGLNKGVWAAGHHLFIQEYTTLIEAGAWVREHVLGEKAIIDQSVGIEQPGHVQSALSEKIKLWEDNLRSELKDELVSGSYEMQRDLSLARDFQRAYLERPYPRVPAVHVEGHLRLSFHHLYKPTLALGGDFYDILSCAPDCAGVFIADVMGHGTRSALITAILRTLIHDMSRNSRNTRFFISEMNNLFWKQIQAMPDPLFVSAFYFVADTTARVATYCSAGHPAPFLVRRHSRRVMRLDTPAPRGAALGVIPHEEYTAGQCRLLPGDFFLFFTDGVYEAHNIEGEEFGIDRMSRLLEEHMYKNAEEIVEAISRALTAFVGEEPIADDICMVAVDITDRAET